MNIFKGSSYKGKPTAELKKYQFFSFQDFCEKGLKKCQKGSKFEGYITIGDEYKITKGDPDAHFKSYKYQDHFHRNNPSQVSASLLPFDGDNSKSKAGCCIEPILIHQALKEASLNHCIYTTHSHRTVEHPNKIRWRLLLPCKMGEQGQLAPTVVNLYNLISKNGCEDLAMATESKTWSVPWFLPTRDNPDDNKFEFYSYYEGDNFEASDAESIAEGNLTNLDDDKVSMDDMVLTIMNGVPDTGVHIAITKYIYGQKKDGVLKATTLANLKGFIHNWPKDDYHQRYYDDMIRDLDNIYKKDKKALVGDYEKTGFTTAKDFNEFDFPDEVLYLKPWLSEDTITLISGERGCGKSWFVFGVLQAIADKSKFGPWEGINSVPVLYLDGEMGKRMVQKRLGILKINNDNFYILNNHKTLDDGGVTANITNEGYRDWIQKEMLEKGVKVFAVDNVSCLCPGLNENSKEDWDDINQWLIKLKHLGISTILIHHLGKDKISARGTSGREDNIDISIILKKPKNYKVTDKARFQVVFTKHRQDVDEPEAISDLEFKLINKEWEVKNSKTASEDQVADLFHEGNLNQSEIADVVGITKGQVSKIKSKLIKDGLLDKDTKKLIGKQSSKNIFDKES